MSNGRRSSVALAVWTLLVGAVVSHPWLPWWLTVPLLAIGSGWFASLQHEVAHGHPTPWPALNVAIAGAPIGFVYPFSRFTELHLAHHRDPAMLTEPGIDNESRYCSPEAWARAGRPMRLVLRIERTLVGHLTIGVVRSSLTYVVSDLAAARTDRRLRLIWARHLVGVAVVVALIVLVGPAVLAVPRGRGLRPRCSSPACGCSPSIAASAAQPGRRWCGPDCRCG